MKFPGKMGSRTLILTTLAVPEEESLFWQYIAGAVYQYREQGFVCLHCDLKSTCLELSDLSRQ